MEAALFWGPSGSQVPSVSWLCHFLRVVVICRIRAGSLPLALSISAHGKGDSLLTAWGRSGSHDPPHSGEVARVENRMPSSEGTVC